jgi:hypothetical protein
MRKNQIAAATHARMCNDERFGYSWEERWGNKAEQWTVGGVTFPMNVGDYDCSSSTITAWRKALTGTKYAHALDDATYTGNMREVFVGSGLFEWKPMSFLAEPGDLYLNEENHVAMCQTQVPDVLSEFSWGDNGAYGNRRGDQDGGESSVHAYYDYPWDGILHYNGKADTTMPTTWKDGTYVATHTLKIREKRGGSSSLVCLVAEGATLKLGKFATNAAGNLWAQVLAGDHKGRYVCVRNAKGTYVKRK